MLAQKFINRLSVPIVVKADGLASGKGVYICDTKNKALKATKKIISGKFKSSSKVLLEEYLDGEEMSYFIIADENNYKYFEEAAKQYAGVTGTMPWASKFNNIINLNKK